MSQTKLTHKVRNPKAGQENSWIDIWTATVDNNNNYTITPSDNWRFSTDKLTDLVVPFYNLDSDSEIIENNSETNNLKSISIKLQEDNNLKQKGYEKIAGEIKISAGSNVTLTGSDNNYSINSTWQQNTITQNGYVSSIEEERQSQKLVWGYDGNTIGWISLAKLDTTSSGWETITGSPRVGPYTEGEREVKANVLWLPNQVTTDISVRQDSSGNYVVRPITKDLLINEEMLALPQLVVIDVDGLENLNSNNI